MGWEEEEMDWVAAWSMAMVGDCVRILSSKSTLLVALLVLTWSTLLLLSFQHWCMTGCLLLRK